MTAPLCPGRWRALVAIFAVVAALCAGASVRADLGPLEMAPEVQERVSLAKMACVFSVSSAEAGKTYAAAMIVDIEPGWHINSAQPYQNWLIPAEVTFDSIPGLTPHGIAYPEGTDAILAGESTSVYDGRIIVRFSVTVGDSAAAGELALPVRLTYQPCNDSTCSPPETDDVYLPIKIGHEGRPINEDIFALYDNQEPQRSSASSVATESSLQRLIDKHGFWGYFLALGLAFVTGLLLSFSPCTYPMIPITVSVFAGQQRSLGRGFVLSLFYVGSMAFAYGVMGLIVSLVGGVFGAWLASTPVVIAIAVVFVVFSLSMFGLFELNIPSALRQKLGTTKTGGGVTGAIVLGIVAALVVSPCVGPFVAGILMYVATHGSPVIGFLILFVFALGLGTLFVIIGTFSSAINALPGSGEWMNSVKRFFGFVLLVMALYFLRTIMPPTATAILAGLVLVAFGIFGGGLDHLTPEAGLFARLKKFLGVVAMIVGVYLLAGTIILQGLILPPASEWLPAVEKRSQETLAEHIDWETDLDAGLARAMAQGKPVLIDTWATWCANCRVLDKKTFGDPRVVEEARRFVPIKVQLETMGSQITEDFMARFGLRHYSLPTTLLLDSAANVRLIRQGVIDPEDMVAEMRQVR